MKKLTIISAFVFAFANVPAMAIDDETVDAAIGGGLGGAAGAAIGNEVGGRDGAILGGALGGGAGAAVTTDDDGRDHRFDDHRRNRGNFCPPGQAKKGRC